MSSPHQLRPNRSSLQDRVAYALIKRPAVVISAILAIFLTTLALIVWSVSLSPQARVEKAMSTTISVTADEMAARTEPYARVIPLPNAEPGKKYTSVVTLYNVGSEPIEDVVITVMQPAMPHSSLSELPIGIDPISEQSITIEKLPPHHPIKRSYTIEFAAPTDAAPVTTLAYQVERVG